MCINRSGALTIIHTGFSKLTNFTENVFNGRKINNKLEREEVKRKVMWRRNLSYSHPAISRRHRSKSIAYNACFARRAAGFCAEYRDYFKVQSKNCLFCRWSKLKGRSRTCVKYSFDGIKSRIKYESPRRNIYQNHGSCAWKAALHLTTWHTTIRYALMRTELEWRTTTCSTIFAAVISKCAKFSGWTNLVQWLEEKVEGSAPRKAQFD